MHRPTIDSIAIGLGIPKETFFELVRPIPGFFRYVNFPVEVTEEIRILADEDDKTTI